MSIDTNADFDEFCQQVTTSIVEAYDLDPEDLIVNVGTPGHCDYGESVVQTALKTLEVIDKMDKRKILVICAGMGLANFRFATGSVDAIPITAMDRRFMIDTYNTKPELPPEQSWQTMNRGKLSKKQRRKL